MEAPAMKFYTGIGSRETPDNILYLMEYLGEALASLGWTLRSGGADGADSAFERGAMRGMHPELLEPWPEIYIPWEGFNGRPLAADHFPPTQQAHEIASQFHPVWDRLGQGAKKLHARNTHQILGQQCIMPSSFVACWTPGGKGRGGTGQAIRLATHYEVPVYDMGAGDPHMVVVKIKELVRAR